MSEKGKEEERERTEGRREREGKEEEADTLPQQSSSFTQSSKGRENGLERHA